ncbi:hypothetical protein QVZ41_14020 [Wenyingzhuangia sp. chi5]|uniref:HEPN domain-containing protein n=1 Tax=Wenyingzhuangia gilva TaxID=3057677 RepID=A0ABT8VVG4_9FLAO|nr:hypothetical protein [Wenyingzhuangia sp. chi5]MDO3695964.1 hypothetical protein [Wenyingzhuangia sp. chi5]
MSKESKNKDFSLKKAEEYFKNIKVDEDDDVSHQIFKNRELLHLALYKINRNLFLIDTKSRIEDNHGVDPNYESIKNAQETCLSLLLKAEDVLRQEISR